VDELSRSLHDSCVEIAPDAVQWQPWTPSEAARRLEGVDAPWGVTAGWALELFVGERWRGHEDLEVAVPADRFGGVHAALGELEFWVPVGDERLRPLADVTQPASQQTWGLERHASVWRIDVFREPSDGEIWICRRDQTIRLPYARLLERTRDGIPFVRPEVVLLFKAKHTREKDQEDFDVVLPRLDRERRRWLRVALERVQPGHPCLGRLDG
jgi:hypothetical protein